MAQGKLAEEVKTFIVQALACFDSPSTVVAAVRQEFGETITRQTVEGCDPTKRAGRDVATKWRALFEETRKTFLKDTSRIGMPRYLVDLQLITLSHQMIHSVSN